ncbi:PrsW family intramembrane metalloprotease, partial [Patescibacteria group bacterium]|nr:PrsW family intramembrane metalloprotease [Patescibacteria group bacterium]
MNTQFLWVIASTLAVVPVAIWLYIIFKDKKQDKKILALMFSGGILAVLTVFGLQYFWSFYPEFDPFLWIEEHITSPAYYYVAIFVMVGILEELVKQMMVRYVDSKTVLIQTVNDSIRFSLAAALGFAFAENIVYFYNVMISASIDQVIITFIFRSTFTACAHMVFSGIFGYYFGIAKFTIDISREKNWEGKMLWGVKLIKWAFRMPYAHAFKEYKILQGLLIAL